MYKDLIIFEKTYEFNLWLFPAVQKFPKNQRFVLGQHIQNTSLRITMYIVQVVEVEGQVVLSVLVRLEMEPLARFMVLAAVLQSFLPMAQAAVAPKVLLSSHIPQVRKAAMTLELSHRACPAAFVSRAVPG